MSTFSRLSKVFNTSREIFIDDTSKIIFFSDCHRGDNSWADIFARNQNSYFAALTHYLKEEYTYIEIGDGDELWANRSFSKILQTHKDVFMLIKEFYNKNHFHMIWGNHDIVKKSKRFAPHNLYYFYDNEIKKSFELFTKIECSEGLILKYKNNSNKIFVVHGHQGDFLNDTLWRLSRLLIRYLWRPLEIIGFNDITSPAKNYKKRDTVEGKIVNWVKANNMVLIAGHTHRPVFPDEGQPQYFNDGSCVHPRCITGIEIQNGEIVLIKWSIKTREDGTLYVDKDIIAGPRTLKSLFPS